MLHYLSVSFDSYQVILWSICIGFNVAMLLSFLFKHTEGKLISRLLSQNASSEDSAVSLSDIGLGKSKYIMRRLRDESTLRHIVSLAGGQELSLTKGGKAKNDFSSAKFYISEENSKKASSMQKGALKWYFLPIFCAVSIALTSFVNYVIPIFINW